MEQVMLQTQWGWPIALYLFLGGLGAGTLLVSALLDLKFGERMRKIALIGAIAAVACLGIGTCLLLVDVTEPGRAIMLWQSFVNFGSWMAIGAWLLAVGMLAAALYAVALSGKLAAARKPLAIVGAVLGVCIAAYTGILLSVLAAHPLWNTALLPVLFLVSAVDTGVALVAILIALKAKEDHDVAALLEKATLALVAAEAVALVALLALVASGSETGALSVSILATGQLALPFWGLFVAVGLVAPAACAALSLKAAKAAPAEEAAEPRKALPLPVIGAACCLVGGLALRFLILLAGIPVWM